MNGVQKSSKLIFFSFSIPGDMRGKSESVKGGVGAQREHETQTTMRLTFGSHWCSLVLSQLGWKVFDHCYHHRAAAVHSKLGKRTEKNLCMHAHTQIYGTVCIHIGT